MVKQIKKGCGKKLHYSVKAGNYMFCGLNYNTHLYLCKKCKNLSKEKGK